MSRALLRAWLKLICGPLAGLELRLMPRLFLFLGASCRLPPIFLFFKRHPLIDTSSVLLYNNTGRISFCYEFPPARRLLFFQSNNPVTIRFIKRQIAMKKLIEKIFGKRENANTVSSKSFLLQNARRLQFEPLEERAMLSINPASCR